MIYGLAGPAGAGKDTLGAMLRDEIGDGAGVMAFADPLRDMLEAGLGIPRGMMTDRKFKERIIPELGVSPRYLLQTLGTEWGRELVAPDLWLLEGMRRAEQAPHAIITDVRFPEEAEAVRAAGGLVVHVERPGYGGARPRGLWGLLRGRRPHPSERPVPEEMEDRRVLNDGNLEELRGVARQLARGAA